MRDVDPSGSLVDIDVSRPYVALGLFQGCDLKPFEASSAPDIAMRRRKFAICALE